MLGFNFIPGSIFIFLCFILIIVPYHIEKQRKIKIEPRIKLNHNINTYSCIIFFNFNLFIYLFIHLFIYFFTSWSVSVGELKQVRKILQSVFHCVISLFY